MPSVTRGTLSTTADNFTVTLKLPSRRPLVPVGAAVTLLDMDPLAITQACESGKLGWVFDVGCGDKRELRIWRGSIAARLKSGGLDGGGAATEEDVLADILPNRDLRSSELWRRLGISRKLLVALLPRLKVLRKASAERGVNACEIISRDSVVRLLKCSRLN